MKVAGLLLLALLLDSCAREARPAVVAAAAAQKADRDDTLHAGLLVLDGVYGSELVAPWDILHHTRFHTGSGMRVFTVGRTKEVVTTFEGLAIRPDYDLESAPRIDVLVVPSAEHNMDTDLEDEELIAWIRKRARGAQWLLSVCDGAFLLAEAGLLEGRRCTTFPGDVPAFRRRYPRLDVVEGVSFVASGNVVTGAGGARSYDPALYIVEKVFGKGVARGVGRGMVLDWRLDDVAHVVASGPARAGARPRCWLPGDRVDPGVRVEDARGRSVTLAEIAAGKDAKGIVLCILGGAEGGATRKRGGLWCEDSYGDLSLLRHLELDYGPKGIRFVAVCCPPVYHERAFGYDAGAFLTRPDDDPIYRKNRDRFVQRTVALAREEVLPFAEIYFDPRFRLLSNPKRGEAEVGPRPGWQGRFRWYADTQAYGTPTIWVLEPDLTVYGIPFFMNVYEVPGRKLRYTVRDIGDRLDRLLRG